METKTSQPDAEAPAINAEVSDIRDEAATVNDDQPTVDRDISSMVNQFFESSKELFDESGEQFMAMNVESRMKKGKTSESESEGRSVEKGPLNTDDEMIKSSRAEIDIMAKEDKERMTEYMGYHNDIPDTVMIDLEPGTHVKRDVAHVNVQRRAMIRIISHAQFAHSGPRDGTWFDIPMVEDLYRYLGSLKKRGLARLVSVDHSNDVSPNVFRRSKILVDIGDLNKLPFELTLNVLSHLDMHSMTVVRLINRSCKGIVDAYFPDYKDLLVHASANILRVIQAVNLSPLPSINQVYAILCTDRCVICNGFGTYFFLLTGSRCCFPCLENSPQFRAITRKQARYLFGLRNKEMAGLPTMTSLPGEYTFEYRYRDAESLVGFEAALDLGMQLNGTRHAMLDVGVRIWAKENPGRVTIPDDIGYQRTANERFLTRYMDKFRGMAFIPLPFVDTHRNQIEDGISCLGCAVERRWWRKTQMSRHTRYNGYSEQYVKGRYKVYTRAEFLEHLEVCEGAKDFWEKRRLCPDMRSYMDEQLWMDVDG